MNPAGREKTFSEMPASSSGGQRLIGIIVIVLIATVVVAIVAARTRTQPVGSHASGTDQDRNALLPQTPTVSGPIRLVAGSAASFTFNLAPYEGHAVGVEVQWGDGASYAKCCDTAAISLTHAFSAPGTYTIRARSATEDGAKSSDVLYPLTVEAAPGQ